MAVTQPKFWPWKPWRIDFQRGELRFSVEPTEPFVLIGSHERCGARLDDLRVPPVVYLACSFIDSIEVWPLCSIAFARWGLINSLDELVVGKTVVTISQAGDTTQAADRAAFRRPGEPAISAKPIPPVPPSGPATHGHALNDAVITSLGSGGSLWESDHVRLDLDCFDKWRTRDLRRRITILGSRHPSTLRLRAHRLKRVDRAIVSLDGRVWLIDLDPPPNHIPWNPIQSLGTDTPPISLGSMRVSLGRRPPEVPSRAQSPISPLPISHGAHASPAQTTKPAETIRVDRVSTGEPNHPIATPPLAAETRKQEKRHFSRRGKTSAARIAGGTAGGTAGHPKQPVTQGFRDHDGPSQTLQNVEPKPRGTSKLALPGTCNSPTAASTLAPVASAKTAQLPSTYNTPVTSTAAKELVAAPRVNTVASAALLEGEDLGSRITDRQVAKNQGRLRRIRWWAIGISFAAGLIVALIGWTLLMSRNSVEK